MAVQFPTIKSKLGLGVGMDMPWGDSFGFDVNTNKPTEKVLNFLKVHGEEFSYGFISCHMRGREKLDAQKFKKGFESYFSKVENFKARSLHHTFLNLGAMENYEKKEICDFTNELVKEFNLEWINEDLGVWSIKGKTLPYPLPPFLTEQGLQACIRNVREYQEGLTVPLLIEFPGFTDGTNFFIGRLNAYDYFNQLASETQSPVTLDTGHLISYQWLLGKRGEDLFSDLERLPLANCFEIHLSGCQIVKDRFMDFHHGVIMDEQIEILKRLIPLCPNLKAITYEDPKFDNEGRLFKNSLRNFTVLKDLVRTWEAA